MRKVGCFFCSRKNLIVISTVLIASFFIICAYSFYIQFINCKSIVNEHLKEARNLSNEINTRLRGIETDLNIILTREVSMDESVFTTNVRPILRANPFVCSISYRDPNNDVLWESYDGGCVSSIELKNMKGRVVYLDMQQGGGWLKLFGPFSFASRQTVYSLVLINDDGSYFEVLFSLSRFIDGMYSCHIFREELLIELLDNGKSVYVSSSYYDRYPVFNAYKANAKVRLLDRELNITAIPSLLLWNRLVSLRTHYLYGTLMLVLVLIYVLIFYVQKQHIKKLTKAEKEKGLIAKFPDQNPNPVLRIDRDGNILYKNKAAAFLVDQWMAINGEKETAYYLDFIKTLLENDQSSRIESSLNDRFYSFTFVPIVSHGYINLYGWDITDRVKAEKRAKQQQEQLLHADRMVSMGIMASGIVHEINNPNNYIMLNTPILRRFWNDSIKVLDQYRQMNGDFQLASVPYSKVKELVPELFSGIQTGSERISSFTKDMKGFMRKKDEELNVFFNINDAIISASKMLSNLINKTTSKFVVDLGEIPLVFGSCRRLEQVIINLISNALDALQSRESGIYISTAYDEDSHSVICKIRDEGKGIESSDLKHLCDPFFTTKRDKGGTGLGLSVSSKIIHDHYAQMVFESEVGKGTTVKITFPAANNQRESIADKYDKLRAQDVAYI